MQKKLLLKFAVIASLILFLLIPLIMIEGVINDRQRYQHEAFESIKQSWTGNQTIVGPLLVIPYEKRGPGKALSGFGQVSTVTEHKLIIAPETLKINGHVNTEERQRGIYKIPVYTSDMKIEGTFSNHEYLNLRKSESDNPKLIIKKPYISMFISDLRGIVHQPQMSWNNQKLKFQPGSHLSDKNQTTIYKEELWQKKTFG